MASIEDSKALQIVNKLIHQLSPVATSSNANEHKFATKLTELPDIQVFSERVICILGQNASCMTLQGTNTYLVGTGKKRLLIEAGEGIESYIPILTRAMKENGVESLQGIICTHWHSDHIKGIPSVRKAFGQHIPIYKYESKTRDESLDAAFTSIKDKEVFKCEGATLIAHHTPGHTDDHIVLELKEEKAIFTGDCILGEGSCVFEDLYLYMLSLQRLLAFECDCMYPGHGPKITDARKKIKDYIQHRNNREQQILKAMQALQAKMSGDSEKRGMDSYTICGIVYDQTPQALMKQAHSNLQQHLHKLVMEGKVSKTAQNKYFLVNK